MINSLIEQKEKYFWSKSQNGTVIVGGYNHGRFYGTIEFSLDEDLAIVKLDISDGVSSSQCLASRLYSPLTHEYSQIKQIFESIDEYLDDPIVRINQDLNREILLQNVLALLPKYVN